MRAFVTTVEAWDWLWENAEGACCARFKYGVVRIGRYGFRAVTWDDIRLMDMDTTLEAGR